ncbi:MAG: acetyl-CoA carboxylase biotin carboxyl carrier protein [Alphaproteobacteria bacterium]|nr:MAG: acetyl-CoA carboxylase biotin carboxyl carrier protein [Alphaproteobacteria bacterium]
MDLKQLDQLAKWLETTGLEEVEIETSGTRLRLRKPGVAVTAVAAPVAAAPQAAAAPAAAPVANNDAITFKSPMVGTFYRAGSPDAAPFVKEGDVVSVGQPIAIIEAMKTMNQIEADRAGTITKVFAQNAQAVEFGQPLFIIQ